MSSTTSKRNTSKVKVSEHDISQITNDKQDSVVPQIEVVNEIQIIVSKKENPRNSINITTPNDNKDMKKCTSSPSSKTDLTVTTPTTATLDATTKNVTIKNERRSSKEKERSIWVCGKLLKRVKELLATKESKVGGK
jgi:ATP-dependent 26S proteasome regulatory subunit